MHHYENVFHTLPPARLGTAGASWAVLTMPFLEQDNLYRQWNLAKSYYEQNDIARKTALPIYFCPGRRTAPGSISMAGDLPGGAGSHVPGALADYAGNFGTADGCVLTNDGAFQLGSGIRFSAITDGTSNTLLVGDKHVPNNAFGLGWLDSSVYNGEYPISYLRGANPVVGLAQFHNDPGWKFGSYHTGVCQFVLCDGSVRGLFHGISPITLTQLCQINDGTVIGDF
jgi:hypothetical protein